MKELRRVGNFNKDIKLAHKRGKNLTKLQDIMDMRARGDALPVRCRPHKLSGNWAGHWELHIEPDWLLIYQTAPDAIYLYRTGTHADLFE